MKLEKELKEIGLHDVQSKIYMNLLSLGEMHIADIVRCTGIKRTTIYYHIDTLVEENLLERIKKGKRSYYRASHPRNILNRQEKRVKKIKGILYELDTLYQKNTYGPAVHTYQGKQEIKNLYMEISDTLHPIYSMVSFERFFSLFSKNDMIDVMDSIQKNHNHVYNLAEDTELARKHASLKSFSDCEKIKFLPKTFSFDVDVVIFGKSKIAFISFLTQSATVIQDVNIVRLHKMIFDHFWKNNI